MNENESNTLLESTVGGVNSSTVEAMDEEVHDFNGYINDFVDESGRFNYNHESFLGDTAALNTAGLWSDEESEYAESEEEASSTFDKTSTQKGSEVDDNEWEEDLKAAVGFRRAKKSSRGRGRVSRADMVPSVEVQQLLSIANRLFAQEGNFAEAQKIAEEIVRIDNNVIAAWKMLGECHRQRGNERVNIEKCLIAWMAAAHLKPKDYEMWATCAHLNESLEFWDQADYCYSRAILAKPNKENLLNEYIFNRSILNKDHGSLKKAAEGFRQLLPSSPFDVSLLKHLAEVYIRIRAPGEALNAFETAWTHYYQYPVPPIGKSVFDLPALNLYAELLLLDHQWSSAIHLINRGARWFRGRKSETYWDDYDDDREWDVDEKRRKVDATSVQESSEETYHLPYLLRAKLGIARMKIGELEEAAHHFSIIKTLPLKYISGVLNNIAKAYMEIERLDLALEYHILLSSYGPAQNIHLWFDMGLCYLELKEFEHAQQCMEAILLIDNNNINALVKLAEINELQDNRDAALAIVTSIIELQKGTSENEKGDMEVEGRESDLGSRLLINNQRLPQDGWEKRAQISRSKEEARQYKIWKTEHTQRRFGKLSELFENMQNDPTNSETLNSWLNIASELIDEFVNTKALYPNERKARSKTSLLTRHVRIHSLKDQLMNMINRLNDSITHSKWGDVDLEKVLHTKMFRNVSIDSWFHLFALYALQEAKLGTVKQAYEVLKAGMATPVFEQDPIKRQNLRWCMLACAIHAGDSQTALGPLRWTFTTFQFRQDTYRLFSGILSSGYDCSRTFVDSANQKFLLRLVKLMDQLINKSSVPGAATLSKNEDGLATVPTSYDPILFLLYGHIMARSRSWIPAINYYSRAYAMNPDCPMTNLSIGLAYIHRAMQRLSDNRHYQILQGFTFLYHYYDLRSKAGVGEKQEALYNLAKAYHFLGLEHHAVQYYEKVLELSPMGALNNFQAQQKEGKQINSTYDFSYEAAYNLRLIYTSSGNLNLAFEVTKRYLAY
ncbi:transcription factor tfiiic complex subunit sfc4 [Schizosaccharomyces cryophilus OY26]|uniref:Transcription factor tfiiic complex subunit sfc4 n=1 Tax=Schizosaccharomyces cryophilus (strain OY26 / ATCC MYA-4695 / CBS 11777 / NBRC 106824 / NRRL Y48691) TaxID=653667 RepID=S9X818_SCHCR|nr:transcription factor tfiiic complex subunit sfc4 [Schizosaccharomyces cryophilus OY26]EPY49866.1 transcription factor tfiiic complex subunit sfc4 [Schizosaccharomyces cryophilus OY26]